MKMVENKRPKVGDWISKPPWGGNFYKVVKRNPAYLWLGWKGEPSPYTSYAAPLTDRDETYWIFWDPKIHREGRQHKVYPD